MSEAQTTQPPQPPQTTQPPETTQPPQTNNDVITLTMAQLDALLDEKMKKMNTGNTNDSIFKVHDNALKQQQEEKETEAEYSKAYAFLHESKSTIEKHKDLFQAHTLDIFTKDLGAGNSLKDKAEKIKLVASRDFFLNPANLEHLRASDAEIVKSDLLDEHGHVKIKGDKAWDYVENALHIKALKENENQFNRLAGNSKNKEDAQTEVLGAWLSKVSPK